MDAFWYGYLCIAAVGLIQSGLMLAHAWEHRRFYRRRWSKKLKADAGLSVTLIAPCKGRDTELHSNLLALFWQRYPRYEICFVIESENDPAAPVIRELAREHPQVPCRIVVAGLARDCGQKVHNLIYATREILESRQPGEITSTLGGEPVSRQGEGETRRQGEILATEPPTCSPCLPVSLSPCLHPTAGAILKRTSTGNAASTERPDVLAFVDADACPHVDWLSRLVDRLASGKHTVATGYRWYVPKTGAFANRFLSAINNIVIGLTGLHGFNLVWGGAWAIRTDRFEELGLPAAWAGSLSDDLVVSRLVHAAGLRVVFEPHCLVKSSADFNRWTLCEFLRRQFLVAKVYAPRWWHFALWTGLTTNVCLWGTLGAAFYFAVTGGPWAVPLAAGFLYYAAGVLQARLATRAVRPYIAVVDDDYNSVARVNVWGWPLVSLASWLAVASSALGRTIVWRGIGYRMNSPQSTTLVGPSVDFNRENNSHARATTRAA